MQLQFELMRVQLEPSLQQLKHSLNIHKRHRVNYENLRVAVIGFNVNTVGADAANNQKFDCQLSTRTHFPFVQLRFD